MGGRCRRRTAGGLLSAPLAFAPGAPWCPTAEQERLLQACLLPAGQAPAAAAWWQLGEAAVPQDRQSRSLLPFVYLRQEALQPSCEALKLAQAAYLEIWGNNQRRFQRLAEVLERFALAGIRSVLLKGAALATHYYSSEGLRDMGDVDVLVRPEDLGAAAGLLAALGWTCGEALSGLKLAAQMRIRHAWGFYDRQGLSLDLHWRPFASCYCPEVAAELWQGVRSSRLRGVPVGVLDDTGQLFCVCVHAVQTGANVRWIADSLAIFARGEVDWERLAGLARRSNLTVRLQAALGYLAARFATAVPVSLAAGESPAWEHREAYLQAEPFPWSPWQTLQWHWWTFRDRIRPYDASWRRRPALLGFLEYWRLWLGYSPARRAVSYVRRRRESSLLARR
jgi:Uncharacterised nucleotidyltransferase